MAIHIGNSWVFLLLYFYTPFGDLSKTMTLNEEQLVASQAVYHKWKTLTLYCKEHELQLKDIVSKEQLNELKEGKEWLQKLIALPQVKQYLLEEDGDRLTKRVFVDKMERWVNSFIGEIQRITSTDILLNTLTILDYLKTEIYNQQLPITESLWKPIEKSMGTLEEAASPKAIAAAILEGLTQINIDLEAEYQQNRKAYYCKIKASELEGMFLQANDFSNWLNEKIEEARKNKEEKDELLERRKEEKEASELSAYQLFVHDYLDELATKINAVKIENPEAIADTILIDLSLLLRKVDKELHKGKVANKPLSNHLNNYLKKALSAKKWSRLEIVKEHFLEWIRVEESAWLMDQFDYWKEDKGSFPKSGLVAAVINDSYINVNVDSLAKSLNEWAASVSTAFVLSRNYTIDVKRLEKNLKSLFDYSSPMGISIAFVYQDYLSTLLQQQGEKSSVNDLSTNFWKIALAEVPNQNRLAEHFSNWCDHVGPYAIKDLNSRLDTLLPKVEDIQQAILRSSIRKKELQVPELDSNSLNFVVQLRSDKIDKGLLFQRLLIDLEYKNYPVEKDGKIKDFLFVVPTKLSCLTEKNESTSQISLIKSRIRKPIISKTLCDTEIQLKFLVVTNIEKLFNALNIKDIGGYDLSFLLKKLSLKGGKGPIGINVGIEDVLYNNEYTYYVDVSLRVNNLLNSENQGIQLSCYLESKNTQEWKVAFKTNEQTFLKNNRWIIPPYEYK